MCSRLPFNSRGQGLAADSAPFPLRNTNKTAPVRTIHPTAPKHSTINYRRQATTARKILIIYIH